MRLLAALYVAGMLTLAGCWFIRKTDKYFWKGVAIGLFILTVYFFFILAVCYLVYDMPR